MPVAYRRKFLPDGTLNPKWRPSPKRGARTKGGGHKSRWQRREIIAYDGEGVTRASGRHDYTLLCSSRGVLAEVPAGAPRSLSTAECVAALHRSLAEHPKAIHVSFAFSYDVNMIAGSLPRRLVAKLWAGDAVRVPGTTYTLRYTPRKAVSIFRWQETASGKRRKVGGTVWDVWGFFQGTFVGALESYGIGADVRARIQDMKAKRSEFAALDAESIRRYCLDECRELVTLCDTLFRYIDDAQLAPRRYDGAGALSAALLKREGIPAHKSAQRNEAGSERTDPTPDDVREAAQYAYAGGRIELVRYGHAPAQRVYGYDICSAYPAAMCDLPSLAGAQWRREAVAPGERRTFSVYRLRFKFPAGETLYPLFWRAKDGRIYFPREGEGWYWWPEAREAVARYPRHVAIIDAWHCEPATDARPFGWMPGVYALRRQWKREGRGAEKALKLGINGAYGKLAQRVGMRDGKPPSMHQLEWAGWITSATRAKLYAAAMQAPAACIMLATDAVYSTVPLALDMGGELGQWEASEYAGCTVVQSGVYRLVDDDGTPHDCYRGFDKGTVDFAAIVDAWARGDTAVPAQLTRFMTMGAALAGASADAPSWRKWRRWITAPRTLLITPDGTKRERTARGRPARELAPTRPADPLARRIADGFMSAPSPLPWSRLGGPDAAALEASERIEAEMVDAFD